MSERQRKAIREFLIFARKFQVRDHWNIGGFLAEVEEAWDRDQAKKTLRREGQ